MNKYLKYSRLYLGLFSIVGLITAVLFLSLGFIIGSEDPTGHFALFAGIAMLLVSIFLLAGVLIIKKRRPAGCLLIQFGSVFFIIATSYSLYNFANILSGWKSILLPLTIWLPLCTPFAILIFYIWRWSKS